MPPKPNPNRLPRLDRAALAKRIREQHLHDKRL
eukprot:COSAG02_NODE_67683_length_252_cov_0.803922_1_plen_32_part_10